MILGLFPLLFRYKCIMLSANSLEMSDKVKVLGDNILWFQIFRTETPLDILNISMICAQND